MGWFKTTKLLFLVLFLSVIANFEEVLSDEHQPLAKVAIHEAIFSLDELAYIKASPNVLGLKVSFSFF